MHPTLRRHTSASPAEPVMENGKKRESSMDSGKERASRKKSNPSSIHTLCRHTSAPPAEPIMEKGKQRESSMENGKKRESSMDSGEERASRKKSNDKDTPFSIKLLCSYTGERIEECAMPRRDGSCSMCNTQRANLNKQVTFLSFEDFDQVSELSQFLNRLDHPNIPKVRAALNQTEPTLVVDRIHSVPVKRWLDHQVGKWVMWTVDSTGTQYLQLEEKYSKVFRCISKTLAYLHTRHLCHGNLLEGIWVTEPTEKDVRVSLANFNTSIDFQSGFKQDLKDFKSLVEIAVEKHSKSIEVNSQYPREPAALQTFYNLHIQMEQHENDFEAMREFAIFIYWAPVFFNWEDRRDFIRIVEKFSLQDSKEFEKLVIFDSKDKHTHGQVLKKVKEYAIPQMKDWITRICQMGEDDPVKKLYMATRDSRAYQHSGGIYWLHRCALQHYETNDDRDSDQAAMEDLLSAFPNALPAIFEKLIQTFSRQPINVFGKKLELYLREGL